MRKINVLQFITPAGFYGAEMWILALANNLDRDKVNCRLAVTKESEEQNMELYSRFKRLGLDAVKIKMSGRFDPRSVARLVQLIREMEIDIIHTHGYKSDILGLVAARIAGIKAIATPHGFENARDLKLQLFMRLGCLALKHFDIVAPLSDELMSDMDRIGVGEEKVRFIQNGVDLADIEHARQEIPSRLYKDGNEKKICYIGQMAGRKNVIDLIRTFDSLYGRHKDVRLVLIGDGPQRALLQEQAGSMRSFSKIDFLGYRDDRLQILKEVDLFSMTSTLEGIPRCMMEAMAMLVPVAAYNIPGVDKLIIDGKTGLMVEFGDIEGLRECWERLLYNGELAEALAFNGREHIERNFSAGRMAGEYMEVYRRMIS